MHYHVERRGDVSFIIQKMLAMHWQIRITANSNWKLQLSVDIIIFSTMYPNNLGGVIFPEHKEK